MSILKRPSGLQQDLPLHLQIVEFKYTQMLFVSLGISQHKGYLPRLLRRNRFRDYETHKSLVDKPYLGHYIPGFQKYVKTPRKVQQFNSFHYPTGYSKLMEKVSEAIGAETPNYESVEGSKYPVLPPSSQLSAVYDDLNGQIKTSVLPRREKYPSPPTFLYRIRTHDQPGKFANSLNMATRTVSNVPDQFQGLIVPDLDGSIDLSSPEYISIPAPQLAAMELSVKHLQDHMYHTQAFTSLALAQLGVAKGKLEELIALFPDAAITIPAVVNSLQPLTLAQQALNEVSDLHQPMLQHTAFSQGSMEMARRHTYLFTHNLLPCMQEEDKLALINSPVGTNNLFDPDSCISAQHAALDAFNKGYLKYKSKVTTTQDEVVAQEEVSTGNRD